MVDAVPSSSDSLKAFFDWFSALESDEQEVLMDLVYREKKVRDVVQSLGSMGLEQRREVFERLGLPVDLVTRVSAPEVAALTDPEVEWVDWRAPRG